MYWLPKASPLCFNCLLSLFFYVFVHELFVFRIFYCRNINQESHASGWIRSFSQKVWFAIGSLLIAQDIIVNTFKVHTLNFLQVMGKLTINSVVSVRSSGSWELIKKILVKSQNCSLLFQFRIYQWTTSFECTYYVKLNAGIKNL